MINLLVLSVESNFALALVFSKFAPFSQPINRDLCARVFPRFAPVTRVFASNCDWFIVCALYYISVVIGQSNYFRFSLTTLN